MASRIFTNRSSLAGSAARDAKSSRTDASSVRIQAGSAARSAEASKAEVANGSAGMGLNLSAHNGQVARQSPPRLFPGPSGRPEVTAGVLTEQQTPSPSIQVQRASYPEESQSGTVTSIGSRAMRPFQSLFK